MSRVSRRRFLKASAAGVAAAGVVGGWSRGLWAAEGPATTRSLRRLGVAVVGVGGRGSGHLNEVAGLAEARIVAVCDADSDRVNGAVKKIAGAEGFRDFREALKHPGVEAVLIATPDHTHAVIAAAAMRAGKHVYCEKPLAHTVQETRVLTEMAAANPRLCTQLGIQIHSMENYRRVVEVIRAGAIGEVREVHIWNNRVNRPADPRTGEPPKSLDYEMWLGPVAWRAYHPDFHPFNWRRYWAFGEGLMGDIGSHYLDLVFWALGVKYPTRVSAVSPEEPTANEETTPGALIVKWEFPMRGGKSVGVTWYDPPHRPEGIGGWGVPEGLQKEGVMFVGERGMVCSNYTSHVLLPEEKFKGYARPEKSIPASPGHQLEWVRACLAGEPSQATCGFGYGGPLTEAALLGPVAYRVGREIRWDGEGMRAVGDEGVGKLIRYEYREGWKL